MGTWSRRAAGLGLLLLSLLPLHRLLTPDRTGPWGAQALDRADLSWNVTLWGSLVVLLLAVLGALWGRRGAERGDPSGRGPSLFARSTARLAGRIEAPSRRAYSVALGTLAGLLALTVALVIYRGLLTNVDEMTALIHARYLAAGMLAGPVADAAEAWLVPNMLVVDAGWVSQYPPGHLAVLAAFSRLGIWWATGPALFAVMVAFSAASFERLLPGRLLVPARVAALLLASSPFALLLAGGALSHLTAGAGAAVALYAALRAAQGGWGWAFAAGLAVGVTVLARPWTGLLLGPTLTLGVWWARGGAWGVVRSIGPWVAGGVPCAALLFAYNDALFGSPLTLGYEVLYGPAHRLGLHPDPWSFPYGALEALGYSASDLIQFGATLLETPVSLTAVAGAYLLFAARLDRGVSVVAAWAVLPVLGNALYWFHQPRMLFETAPAFILLSVLAVAALLARSAPAVRTGIWCAVAVTVMIGAVAFAPARFQGHAWADETLSRITVPDDESRGAVVFVHASWNERTAATLQAAGMRNDSIQAVVRRNDACRLHEYAQARLAVVRGRVAASPDALPPIDLEQTSEPPARLTRARGPGGAVLLRDADVEWSRDCLRAASADAFGSIALAPLLWQGDLPGLERGAPLFVRDLGPAGNAAILDRFSGRPALVFTYAPGGGPPALHAYDDAMRFLWNESPPGA